MVILTDETEETGQPQSSTDVRIRHLAGFPRYSKQNVPVVLVAEIC